MRSVMVGVVVILAASLAPEAVVRGAEPTGSTPAKFNTFRTRHYEITTDMDRDTARKIAVHMDGIFAEYSRRLSGFRSLSRELFPLYVFATREKYEQYLAERGHDATNTAGVFFVDETGSGLAAWLGDQPMPTVLSTLQHEGFHQFAWSNISRDLPQWVNEGLAEYFGEAMLVKGRFRIGQASESKLKLMQRMIETDQHIPLSELLNISNGEWNARVAYGDPRAGLQYEQSWAVCYFLVHGDKGRYTAALERYLKLMNSGMDSAQAFGQAFGTDDYALIEAAWKRFMLAAEPDAVTTMMQRLKFLAEGVKLLHARQVAVTDLEELKTKLREIEFRTVSAQHGVVTQMRADEDENFAVPQPAKTSRTKADAPAVQLKASKETALPPEIVVEGISPSMRVKWKRDDAAGLTYEVVLE